MVHADRDRVLCGPNRMVFLIKVDLFHYKNHPAKKKSLIQSPLWNTIHLGDLPDTCLHATTSMLYVSCNPRLIPNVYPDPLGWKSEAMVKVP